MMQTKRPLKFKLDAYMLYQSGLKPLDAFQRASEMNDNVALSGCMTTKAYASGYMSDDIKNFLRKKLKANDQEVHDYFAVHNLNKDF